MTIRIVRGTPDEMAASDRVLENGQPWSTTDPVTGAVRMGVGDGESTAVELLANPAGADLAAAAQAAAATDATTKANAAQSYARGVAGPVAGGSADTGTGSTALREYPKWRKHPTKVILFSQQARDSMMWLCPVDMRNADGTRWPGALDNLHLYYSTDHSGGAFAGCALLTMSDAFSTGLVDRGFCWVDPDGSTSQTETPTVWLDRSLAIQLGTGLAVATNDTITKTNHRLIDDCVVRLSSVVTAVGVTARDYYVVSATTSTFKVSLTKGGSPVDVTTAGTATVSYVGAVMMLYQINTGVLTVGNPTQTRQDTRLAASPTGLPGTFTYQGTTHRQPSDLTPGVGHNGYQRVFRLGGTLFSIGLQGGGAFSVWRSQTGMPGTWVVDGTRFFGSRAKVNLLDGSDGTWLAKRNSGGIVDFRGRLWFVGPIGPSSGGLIPAGIPQGLFAAPLTPNLKDFAADPVNVDPGLLPWEADSADSYGLMFSYDGETYMHFRSGGTTGDWGLLILDQDGAV